MKVFWSWQSDTPQKHNKNFVKDALDYALLSVAEDLDLMEAERPELDHDTKGEAGLVSIVDTIFKKIESAKVFVGDITFIGETVKGKQLPNPNVMIELGHAITSLGVEGIILVSNSAYGARPEDLPFDLRHRRGPITFHLPVDASEEDRKKELKKLAKTLTDVLAMILGKVLDEEASVVDFPLYPSRPDDRSTWLLTNQKIEHQGFFNDGGVSSWEVAEEPRFYLRVIPSIYNGTISKRDVQQATNANRFHALSPWSTGDGGANNLGVVAVGFSPCFPDKVMAATQWFVNTSEVWGFNCAAGFTISNGQRFLAYGAIANYWKSYLNEVLHFLASIKVGGPLLVEAGVTGLSDFRWANDFGQPFHALESEIHLRRPDAKWDSETRLEFLTDVFNKLCDAYNQPRLTAEQFKIYR